MKISTYSKITSLSILSILGLSLLFANIATAQLSDVPNHIYKKEIQALIDSECIKGYSDNTFKPDKLVTRVETLKFILECLQMPEIYSEEKFKLPKNAVVLVDNQEIKLDQESEVTFKLPFNPNLYSDVTFLDIDTNSWYVPYLKEAVIRKLISGYVDNTFKPLNNVKKKEFFTILYRSVPENLKTGNSQEPIALDINEKDWSYEAVQFFLENKILDLGEKRIFNPDKELNRGHIAKFIFDYLKWEESKLNPIKEVVQEVIKEVEVETQNVDTQENTIPDQIDTNTLIPNTDENQVGFKTSGKASFYADSLAGNKTASGDIYDPERFMAAHKTFAFGTILKVTNVSNGKWVKVVIQDRGPYAENRLIDLSKSSFQALDDLSKGIINVEIEILETP
ncbi:septal ring lytic transglycosylase RlpA family protein [bacterium]|jgi:rare lipoprotein A|nr:septal ring lytic transglycosylase RlpA family protein [bacterium]MBT6293290.1 septal ring lytic transglycosylase RlpA family protein [bacterium]